MATRLLTMFSIMILELGLMIASLLGVCASYRHQIEMDESGIAGCVMIVVMTVISWLLTIAFFIRKSSRAKAVRIVADARVEAAKILADAMDKAMALCSLDAGRCKKCGNPRTGKFCPKCGTAADSSVTASQAPMVLAAQSA